MVKRLCISGGTCRYYLVLYLLSARFTSPLTLQGLSGRLLDGGDLAIVDGLDALSLARLFNPRLLKLAVGTSSYISGIILGLFGVHSVYTHEHVKAEQGTRCYCWCEETAVLIVVGLACLGKPRLTSQSGRRITRRCHALMLAFHNSTNTICGIPYCSNLTLTVLQSSLSHPKHNQQWLLPHDAFVRNAHHSRPANQPLELTLLAVRPTLLYVFLSLSILASQLFPFQPS